MTAFWIVVAVLALGVCAAYVCGGMDRYDDLMCRFNTDQAEETVEQYADRELAQFECPHLDAAEVQRLRGVAAKQAAQVKR